LSCCYPFWHMLALQNPFVPVAFLTGGFFQVFAVILDEKLQHLLPTGQPGRLQNHSTKGLQVALRSEQLWALLLLDLLCSTLPHGSFSLTKVVFTPEHMATGLNFLGLNFVTKGIDEHQKLLRLRQQ